MPVMANGICGPVPDAEYNQHQHAQEEHTDQQFIAMLDDYRGNGGLARAQEVGALFKRGGGSDLATLASWFAQPNAWLGDRTPAAMLGLDLSAVLNASRAARLTANG